MHTAFETNYAFGMPCYLLGCFLMRPIKNSTYCEMNIFAHRKAIIKTNRRRADQFQIKANPSDFHRFSTILGCKHV